MARDNYPIAESIYQMYLPTLYSGTLLDRLMRLGKILYFGDFVACPTIILCAAAVTALTLGPKEIGLWLIAALIGTASWTLIEYMLHRWAFHRVPWFQRYHDMHHAASNSYVGAPSFLSVFAIVALVFVPLWAINLTLASGAMSGVILGYFVYMLVHHASHFWITAPGSYLYKARLRHARHHFGSQLGNFGVTTKFWDRLFGTSLETRANRSALLRAITAYETDQPG